MPQILKIKSHQINSKYDNNDQKILIINLEYCLGSEQKKKKCIKKLSGHYLFRNVKNKVFFILIQIANYKQLNAIQKILKFFFALPSKHFFVMHT